MIANLVGFFRHQIGSSIKINYNLPEPQRSDAFDILSHMLRIASAGSAPAPSLRSCLPLHVQNFTGWWHVGVLKMKLSEESDVGVGQRLPRTTFVSDGDPLKMLTGVRNRVAMPTSAFRADIPSTKSNNRELYWEIKRYCRSVIQTLPGEHHTISMFFVVLV